MTLPAEPIDADILYQLLLPATRAAWQELRKEHPNERFYVFALMVYPLGDYVYPVANTEESLKRHVGKMSADGFPVAPGGELKLEDSLRWFPAEWSYAGSESFKQFDEYLQNCDSDTIPDGMVHGVCRKVLRALDQEGVFGQGDARRSILLTLAYTDVGESEFLEYERGLNPPEVSQAYVESIKEIHRLPPP